MFNGKSGWAFLSVFLVACGGGGGGGAGVAIVDPGGTAGPVIAPFANCVPSVLQGFNRNIEVAVADAGTGGDGGAAGGGGAAAGGGLGKVLGAQMTVSDLSSGSIVGEGLTDAVNGLVTIKTCSLSGPFLVTMAGRSGAKYFDEGLDQLVDFPDGIELHALVETWSEHVGVSPFTEAAYRYALNNFATNPADVSSGRVPLLRRGSLKGLTKEKVAFANATILAAVNFASVNNLRMVSLNSLPTPVDSSSSANSVSAGRYGISAVVNGGFVRSVAKYQPTSRAPALSGTDYFADDLTDGVLNGYSLDGKPVNSLIGVAAESSRFPVAITVGQNAVSQRFSGSIFSLAADVSEVFRSFAKPRDQHFIQFSGDDFLVLKKDSSVTLTRTPAIGPVAVLDNFLTGVNQVSWGFMANFAMKDDGSIYSWGNQTCGFLGNGSMTDVFVEQPQRVLGLTNIKKIANNNVAGYALDSAGHVYSWGGDLHGLLGRGPNAATETCSDGNTYFANPIPTQIPSLSGIRDITAGQLSAYATTTDGKVYEWGSLTYIGEYQPVSTPRLVQGLDTVVQVAANAREAVAVTSKGRLMGWGGGGAVSTVFGQDLESAVPVPRFIPGFANDTVVQVAADSGSAFVALLATGEIAYWTDTTGVVPVRPAAGRTTIVTTTRDAQANVTVIRTQGSLPRMRHVSGSGFKVTLYAENGDVYEGFASRTAGMEFGLLKLDRLADGLRY